MNRPTAARPERIVGCALIDPVTGGVHPNSHLTLADGRIERVTRGRPAPAPAPGAGASLDGTGLYAVPGLIDMHVHMSADPQRSAHAPKDRYGTATMALLAARNLRVSLEAGITTVRDLGTPGTVGYEVRRAWTEGLMPMARPLVAGPVITAVGGHGAETGLQTRGAEQMRARVTGKATAGADVVKLVMASAARSVELSPEELGEGVATARLHGLPVAVHANFSERSIRAALLAGCDTVEHGFVMGEETVALMRRTGAALCPTLTALHAVVEHADVFREHAGRDLAEVAVGSLAQAEESFRLALAAGVPIIAGTDAGVPFTAYDALHDELGYLTAWGMSTEAALRSATSGAAAALRRPDLGTLAAGGAADIVLVPDNPLEDLSTLRRPVAVLQRGSCVVMLEPERLSPGRDLLEGAA